MEYKLSADQLNLISNIEPFDNAIKLVEAARIEVNHPYMASITDQRFYEFSLHGLLVSMKEHIAAGGAVPETMLHAAMYCYCKTKTGWRNSNEFPDTNEVVLIKIHGLKKTGYYDHANKVWRNNGDGFAKIDPAVVIDLTWYKEK